MLHTDRLAAETRIHHATADANRAELIVPATPANYRRYLATIHGFEARVEASLVQVPDLSVKFLESHLRSGPLAGDLFALGLSPIEREILARALEVPRFAGCAEALGWLFVLERHARVHRDLRHQLARTLPREIEIAGRYLAATPNADELERALDRHTATPAGARAALAGAHDAFARQHAWFTARSSIIPSASPAL